MKPILEISELTQGHTDCNGFDINAQIKITNVSDCYINDLKLIIQDDKSPIFKKAIIRERGSLVFDLEVNTLPIGNLAPQESAYFEYSFKAPETISSLSDCMALTYTPDYSSKTNVTKLSLLSKDFENGSKEQ